MKPITATAWFAPTVLALIVLVAFYVRVDDFSHWLDNPHKYFFGQDQLPMLLGIDGYYYLDIAKDLLRGDYEPFDPDRGVPSGFTRSQFPPALSVVLATISALTTKPLEWVAVALAPFLGVIPALPSFFLGRALGRRLTAKLLLEERREASAQIMGLTVALFTVLSPILVMRSTFGFCDTDPLNVAFSVLAAHLSVCYVASGTPQGRNFYLAASAIVFLLFLWWWDQTYVPVLGLAGLPILLSLCVCRGRSIRETTAVLGAFLVLAAILAVLWAVGSFDPMEKFRQALNLVTYLSGGSVEPAFFPQAELVSEQRAPSLSETARRVAGGWPLFSVALVGLAVFALTGRQLIFLVLPMLVVGCMSALSIRFLIFLGPFFGLGIGVVAYILFNRLPPTIWSASALSVLLLGGASHAAVEANWKIYRPQRHPEIFEGMEDLKIRTPDNSVIWADWGLGHALVHVTDRGTVGDGISHNASIHYVLSFPLAASSYRLAANWMQFYVAHGMVGLRKSNALFGDGPESYERGIPALQRLLESGPAASREMLHRDHDIDSRTLAEVLAFLFPVPERPVYLFVNRTLLQQAWHTEGRWDFARKSFPKGIAYLLVDGIENVSESTWSGTSSLGPISINLRLGQVSIAGRRAPLSRSYRYDGDQVTAKNYQRTSPFNLYLNNKGRPGFGVIADERSLDAVVTKLYFGSSPPNEYFSRVSPKGQYYSIWSVTGDQ